MSSASFMPRPDIHGSLLGLFGLGAPAPVDEPVEIESVPVVPVPEYDDESAFTPADSCHCWQGWVPCSYCENHPEEGND